MRGHESSRACLLASGSALIIRWLQTGTAGLLRCGPVRDHGRPLAGHR